MPFQLSRGPLKILTGVTATAFILGLACLVLVWVTNDLRWGHTGIAAFAIALVLNQRRFAGQVQQRINQVIKFYSGHGRPRPVVPGPRTPDDAPDDDQAAPEPEASSAEDGPAEPK